MSYWSRYYTVEATNFPSFGVTAGGSRGSIGHSTTHFYHQKVSAYFSSEGKFSIDSGSKKTKITEYKRNRSKIRARKQRKYSKENLILKNLKSVSNPDSLNVQYVFDVITEESSELEVSITKKHPQRNSKR